MHGRTKEKDMKQQHLKHRKNLAAIYYEVPSEGDIVNAIEFVLYFDDGKGLRGLKMEPVERGYWVAVNLVWKDGSGVKPISYEQTHLILPAQRQSKKRFAECVNYIKKNKRKLTRRYHITCTWKEV